MYRFDSVESQPPTRVEPSVGLQLSDVPPRLVDTGTSPGSHVPTAVGQTLKRAIDIVGAP